MNPRTVGALVLLALPCFADGQAPRAKPPAKAQCTMSTLVAGRPLSPVLYLDQRGIRVVRPERVAQASASPIESIRAVLLALPPEDWHQGCYIALSETGLRRLNGDPAIEHYEQELNQMLDEIGAQVGSVMSM